MDIQLKAVLRRQLKIRNLNVNSLSRSCKIPASVLHGWTQGVLPSAKNLHHIDTLAKFFSLPISTLLFDRDEAAATTVLFRSEFMDGNNRYRLSIERIHNQEEV